MEKLRVVSNLTTKSQFDDTTFSINLSATSPTPITVIESIIKTTKAPNTLESIETSVESSIKKESQINSAPTSSYLPLSDDQTVSLNLDNKSTSQDRITNIEILSKISEKTPESNKLSVGMIKTDSTLSVPEHLSHVTTNGYVSRQDQTSLAKVSIDQTEKTSDMITQMSGTDLKLTVDDTGMKSLISNNTIFTDEAALSEKTDETMLSSTTGFEKSVTEIQYSIVSNSTTTTDNEKTTIFNVEPTGNTVSLSSDVDETDSGGSFGMETSNTTFEPVSLTTFSTPEYKLIDTDIIKTIDQTNQPEISQFPVSKALGSDPLFGNNLYFWLLINMYNYTSRFFRHFVKCIHIRDFASGTKAGFDQYSAGMLNMESFLMIVA